MPTLQQIEPHSPASSYPLVTTQWAWIYPSTIIASHGGVRIAGQHSGDLLTGMDVAWALSDPSCLHWVERMIQPSDRIICIPDYLARCLVKMSRMLFVTSQMLSFVLRLFAMLSSCFKQCFEMNSDTEWLSGSCGQVGLCTVLISWDVYFLTSVFGLLLN